MVDLATGATTEISVHIECTLAPPSPTIRIIEPPMRHALRCGEMKTNNIYIATLGAATVGRINPPRGGIVGIVVWRWVCR